MHEDGELGGDGHELRDVLASDEDGEEVGLAWGAVGAEDDGVESPGDGAEEVIAGEVVNRQTGERAGLPLRPLSQPP